MISRIEGPGSIRSSSPVRRTSKSGKAGGSSFSKHLEETEGASATSATGAIGSISGVLDIQEVDDALTRASRGKLRAEDLLQKLDELRLDLLAGSISPATLHRLTEVVKTHRAEIDDPKLNEILDEIDLRAQVELAKFTRV